MGAAPARVRADPALVKAPARARRWKRPLEGGRHGSLSEPAKVARTDRSRLGRTLRLAPLAPDIVEAVLDGRQPADIALPALLEPLPSGWDEQRTSVTGSAAASS